MRPMKQILKRWFCNHNYTVIGRSHFGAVWHCPKCDGIFYDYGSQKKRYLGQYDEHFDEHGAMRI